MEYDEMRAMEKTHVCAMCGAPAVTVWDNENNCHQLACGKDKTHNGFKRATSAQTALQRGKMDDLLGPGAQTDLEKRAKETSTALKTLPQEDLGSHAKLTIMDIGAMTQFAESLGLNIHLNHACLYYGELYPTIDGYYYLNNKREKPFRIGTRPMTTEEKAVHMFEEGAHAWIAEAWLDGVKLPDTGIGYVAAADLELRSKKDPEKWRYPVVHDKPQRMAEKRAEWQLLRKLVSLEVKV